MLGHGSGVYPVECAALDIRPIARGAWRTASFKDACAILNPRAAIGANCAPDNTARALLQSGTAAGNGYIEPDR